MAHDFDRSNGAVDRAVHSRGMEYSESASDHEMVSVTDLENFSSHSKHNPLQMPDGGSCILDPHEPAHLEPTSAHSERSETGVHPNRRKPSPEDYHNFILYHGSQKVYEATFIKHFLTHALHPNQLDPYLPPDDENRKHVHRYLEHVLENVDQLRRKMINNTQSRIVKFMASDGKDTTPHHQDMCAPHNPDLRHSDLSGAAIQEISRSFSHGSPPQRPSQSESDEHAGGTSHQIQTTPLNSFGEYQNAIPPGTDLDTNSASPESERNTTADADDLEEHIETEHIETEYNDNDDIARSVGETPLSVEESTLGNLVQSDDLDVPSRQSRSFTPLEKTPSTAKGKNWKIQLIEDHKRRLVEKWPNAKPPQRSLKPGACVKQAIARGYLEVNKASEQVNPDSATSLRSAIQDRSSPDNDQCVLQSNDPKDHSGHGHDPQAEPAYPASPPLPSSGRSQDTLERPTRPPSTVRPRKRQKTTKQTLRALSSDTQFSSNHASSALVPSGTMNQLETHTVIPPRAYFEKKSEDEQPAWRCGISHCMGAYYNSGDRKNCVGCFSSMRIDVNPKRKVMDFYLPSRSFWFHASPEQPWKVSKPSSRARTSSSMSHNSIGKDAYWSAIDKGATSDEAWQKGIEAVEAHLQAAAMKKENKEPALKSAPEPEPVDLGPHPSGSVVMEHGQTLPMEASFKKLTRERHENKAWRCEVNHVFGRYYMAGDIKSCPGCGSSRTGFGKHSELDFFLPAGTAVRQKAPDLVKWKPRKAYNLQKKSQREKQHASHNQIASKKYWELVASGCKHVEGSYAAETLELAIEATEKHIEAKLEAARVKLELDLSKIEEAESHTNNFEVGRDERPDVGRHKLPPPNPRKRSREELDSGEPDGVVECEIRLGTETPPIIDLSNLDDESTSSSDSE